MGDDMIVKIVPTIFSALTTNNPLTSIAQTCHLSTVNTVSYNALKTNKNVLTNWQSMPEMPRSGIGKSKDYSTAYSKLDGRRGNGGDSFEKPPLFTELSTAFGFYILLFLGFVRSILFAPKVHKEKNRKEYPPLYEKFEMFYMQHFYRRVRDCYQQPICSLPGPEVILKDRITKDFGWTFEYPGTQTKCLNLGSYHNFGLSESGKCSDDAREAVLKYGTSMCSPADELGTTALHEELERTTAQFLGVEDAIVFGMGFATNALNIPCLVGPGTLVLSDEKNHSSIILGLKLSGGTVKVFKHNCMKSLEEVLRKNITFQKTVPWKKIVIIVEGIYSMDGTIVHLPQVIELKKKYKAYLYIDEAHSVGAIGPKGRGAFDYHGCDPRDIDILMGTFSKSFGSLGGYIAGSKSLINYVRCQNYLSHYATSMPPAAAAQSLSSLRLIMQPEGQRRIRQLARNTRYFRDRLKQMRVIVYGNDDSPIVPLMVYQFSKMCTVVRILKARGIAAAGVAYPVTPLSRARIRINLSASHSKEQLDHALAVFDQLAGRLGLRYSRLPKPTNPVLYQTEV